MATIWAGYAQSGYLLFVDTVVVASEGGEEEDICMHIHEGRASPTRKQEAGGRFNTVWHKPIMSLITLYKAFVILVLPVQPQHPNVANKPVFLWLKSVFTLTLAVEESLEFSILISWGLWLWIVPWQSTFMLTRTPSSKIFKQHMSFSYKVWIMKPLTLCPTYLLVKLLL